MTTENTLNYATLKRRAVARLFDMFMQAAISILITLSFLYLMRDRFPHFDEILAGNLRDEHILLFVMMNFAFFGGLFSLAYEVFFLMKWNKTPGKMIFGMIVKNEAGNQINLKNILLRNIFLIISVLIAIFVAFNVYVFFLGDTVFDLFSTIQDMFDRQLTYVLIIVSAVTIAFTKQKKAIYDFIGGTIVVKETKLT